MEEINVANQLKAGGEKKNNKLEHHERDLKKIENTHKTSPNYKEEKATDQIHVLKTTKQCDHNDGLRDEEKKEDNVEDAAEKLDNEREAAAEKAKELKEEAKEAEEDAERTIEKADNKASETGVK